jgi:hypothetical protein
MRPFCLSASPSSSFETVDRFQETWYERYATEVTPTSYNHLINNKNMADAQTCEVEATAT